MQNQVPTFLKRVALREAWAKIVVLVKLQECKFFTKIIWSGLQHKFNDI